MNRAAPITFLLLVSGLLKAQTEFRTIVPGQPVVVGESFRVQYIFPGAGKLSDFKTPSFKSFRYVSGPDQYAGVENGINGMQPVNNFGITLEAIKEGRFIIPGAMAMINGRSVRTNSVYVEVISPQQAARLYERNTPGNSDYLLRPGEDPYKKIRENLFLKVMVNRTSCYPGEPVLATFKLYSRLQSRSDIVKNPGFYGFTVYDMVNLADKEMLTEEINGKLFDVHTIRKVQLFPLQQGVYTIDAMEVVNKVEFSGSEVNSKTEQQIVEGVLGNEEDNATDGNAEVYETTISTPPVTIRVKPFPLPGKPGDFNGAVGNFGVSSLLVKDKIARNEQGWFEVIIRGEGNFTQLTAPVIQWPAGMEGFEPMVRDSIDKTQFPLKGSRTFRYSFTCTHPGKYRLPAVHWHYFDPTGNYKSLSSSPVTLEVGNEEKTPPAGDVKRRSIKESNDSASKTAAIIIISLVGIILVYWIRYKKEPETPKEEKIIWPAAGELLDPARVAIESGDRPFYEALHQAVWHFFILHFRLSGSDMNKEKLMALMKMKGVSAEHAVAIGLILKKCEAGMFTRADLSEDKNGLLKNTEELLTQIQSDLFKPA